MKKSGFNLQEIAYVTDHSNYQSLESYLSAPDEEDMQWYADALFSFHDENKDQGKISTPKSNPTTTISKPPKSPENKETQME